MSPAMIAWAAFAAQIVLLTVSLGSRWVAAPALLTPQMCRQLRRKLKVTAAGGVAAFAAIDLATWWLVGHLVVDAWTVSVLVAVLAVVSVRVAVQAATGVALLAVARRKPSGPLAFRQ